MFNVNIEPTITKTYSGFVHADLNNVGTPGATVQVPITKLAKIQQIQILHVVGINGFNIEFYADFNHSNRVFTAESDSEGVRFDLSKMDLYFANLDSPDKQNIIYVKIIPLSGTGHYFSINLFYEKL